MSDPYAAFSTPVEPSSAPAAADPYAAFSAPVAAVSGSGTLDKPYDLSGGQSRGTIPLKTYYRDPKGNIRFNANGDKGNPIFAPAGGSKVQPISTDQLQAGVARIAGPDKKPIPQSVSDGLRRSAIQQWNARYGGTFTADSVRGGWWKAYGKDERGRTFDQVYPGLRAKALSQAKLDDKGRYLVSGAYDKAFKAQLPKTTPWTGAQIASDFAAPFNAVGEGWSSLKQQVTGPQPKQGLAGTAIRRYGQLIDAAGLTGQTVLSPLSSVLNGAIISPAARGAADLGIGNEFTNRKILGESLIVIPEAGGVNAMASAARTGATGGSMLGPALSLPPRAGRAELSLGEAFSPNLRTVPPTPMGAVNPLAIGARPSAPIKKFSAKAPQDVAAMRQRADAMRAANLDPALVDVVDEAGRGVIRDSASRMTPARSAARDFADQRQVRLPEVIGGQAKRIMSNDPRTPDAIRADIVAKRSQEADAAFGAVRQEQFQLAPDAVMALRSPDGRAAIKAAANDALNGLSPLDRETGSMLNRLADGAIDNPGQVQITVGMAQSISKALLDRAEVAQRAGQGNSARILYQLGNAVRDNAKAAVPGYGKALEGYAADSQMIDAATLGEGFLKRNTDEFVNAAKGLTPEQRALASATARRSIERTAGENIGSAPGVAYRFLSPEQAQRSEALLGPQNASKLQNAMLLSRQQVRNALDISPASGPQTANRLLDAANTGGEVAGMLGKAGRADGIGLVIDGVKLWARRLGINDKEAEAIVSRALDPAQTDALIAEISAKRGPAAAATFRQAVVPLLSGVNGRNAMAAVPAAAATLPRN